MKKRLLLSSLIGNLIEYYDYALYGFLTTSIAMRFFPKNTGKIALLETFGIYALGSISKPLGAFFFGHMSDHYGRSQALKINMLGIAAPTAIIGLLPGYDTWGYFAVFGLIVCRFSQGFFLGGEVDINRVYIFEHIRGQFPCLANSFSGSSSYVGIFLASSASTYILKDGMPDDAWRWLFLASGGLALILFATRQFLPETPDFLAAKERGIPLKDILKNLKKPIFSAILICGAVGGCYHFFMIFSVPFISNILGIMSIEHATALIPNSLLLFVLLSPLVGLLADKIGPTRVQIYGVYMMFATLTLFGLSLELRIITPYIFFLISLSLALFSTPGYLILLDAFPTACRCRALGLGHTIGSMLFSGVTPMITTYLYQVSNNIYPPLIWVGILISGVIFALRILPTQMHTLSSGHILS